MIQALPVHVLDADDLVLFVSRTAFDAHSMSIINLVVFNGHNYLSKCNCTCMGNWMRR